MNNGLWGWEEGWKVDVRGWGFGVGVGGLSGVLHPLAQETWQVKARQFICIAYFIHETATQT